MGRAQRNPSLLVAPHDLMGFAALYPSYELRATAHEPLAPIPRAGDPIRLQQRHRVQRVSMKAEGDDAGEKQRSPNHDQAKRKHYRSPWFVIHGQDDNR